MNFPYQPEEVKENVRRSTYEPIVKAASSLRVPVVEFSPEEQAKLRQRLMDKFAYGYDDVPLRSYLQGIHILDKDAWLWVDEFLRDKSNVVLMFSKNYLPMLHFSRGSDVIPVLQRASHGRPLFEYYLADVEAKYLMFYDHEMALYTAGTADEWLQTVLNEVYIHIDAPARPLLVTDVHTLSFGREIVLDCLCDPQVRQPLQINFKSCSNIVWDTFSDTQKHEANVQFIYLGREENRGKMGMRRPRATIRTSEFLLKLDYENLTIEKDW